MTTLDPNLLKRYLLKRQSLLSVFVPLCAIFFAGCAVTPAAPLPTRTPAPTFTATPVPQETPVDPNVVAATQAAVQTAQAAQPAAPADGNQAQATQPPAADPNQGQQPVAEQPTAAPPPPTDTPLPAKAEIVIASPANVRGGPGTTYNIVGSATVGQRFDVLAKSPAGDWWQINFNGTPGWVFGELVTPQNVQAVAIAQNIPAPPPPTNTPIPAPTQPPPPPPTAPPAQPTTPPVAAAPTQPPAGPKKKFNIAVVSKCLPQDGGNWFEGTTYVNGQPTNGIKVVFSYAPDGPPATNPAISGPHEGYTNWNPGYYSHIINTAGAKAGNWFAWVVDDAGTRISEVGSFTFKGPGGDCNQVVVDFDSR